MIFKLNAEGDAPPPYSLELQNPDEVTFEIEASGLMLKHNNDSSHIPWGNSITAATIEAELVKFEELQDRRDYAVIPTPSAPPMPMSAGV